MFSIYGVESIDDLFKKNPELDVATVRNEISNAMEKEVDILGYS